MPAGLHLPSLPSLSLTSPLLAHYHSPYSLLTSPYSLLTTPYLPLTLTLLQNYNDQTSTALDTSDSAGEISLHECLQAFTSLERLDSDQLYYCSSCEKPQMALKKLDLWKLPPILVCLRPFAHLSPRCLPIWDPLPSFSLHDSCWSCRYYFNGYSSICTGEIINKFGINKFGSTGEITNKFNHQLFKNFNRLTLFRCFNQFINLLYWLSTLKNFLF